MTGSVPDLKFDGFVGNVDHAGAKFYADCEVVDGLEAFVGELEKEAGFAYSCEIVCRVMRVSSLVSW